MDSYALDRAEHRVQALEAEVWRLKSDVEHMDWNARTRLRLLDDLIFPFLWFVSCGIVGWSFASIAVKLYAKLFA